MGLKSKIANWTRFQTIITVLAKHGFGGLIHDLGWHAGSKKSSESEETTSIPRRLRLAFEELGPTFIKLGQVLSTRGDLLSEDYIDEFEKLADRIPSFPYETVIEILHSEFGRDPMEIFASIDKNPLAAASIAQVHRAVMKDSEQAVVIKVQRPGITSVIQADIQVLYFIAQALESLREEFRLANLTAIVREFQRTINEELDFTLEASRLDRFHELFPDWKGIEIPVVDWNHTTKKVLTMSELKGKALSQIHIIPENVDRKFLAEQLATFFFESIFFHGLFHADAHAGNVLLNTDAKGTLGLLDFGMVGSLNAELRQRLSKIFLAVVSRDFEGLAVAYSEIGEFGKRINLRDFQSDIAVFLSPHLGKPLREIHIGQLLLESTHIARKYRVKLPRDLILFYRSLMTLEHIGRRLDPDFEFITYGQKFGASLLKRRFSSEEILKDLYKTFEGLRSLGTELPSQVRTIVKKLDDENFPFGGSTMERTIENFRAMNRQNNLTLVTVGLLFSATLMSSLRPDSRLILPLWLAAGILTIYLVGSSLLSRRRR